MIVPVKMALEEHIVKVCRKIEDHRHYKKQ